MNGIIFFLGCIFGYLIGFLSFLALYGQKVEETEQLLRTVDGHIKKVEQIQTEIEKIKLEIKDEKRRLAENEKNGKIC